MFQTSARVRSLADRLELSLLRLGSLMHVRIREIFLGGSKGYNVFLGGGTRGIFSGILLCNFMKFEFSKGGGGPRPPLAPRMLCVHELAKMKVVSFP